MSPSAISENEDPGGVALVDRVLCRRRGFAGGDRASPARPSGAPPVASPEACVVTRAPRDAIGPTSNPRPPKLIRGDDAAEEHTSPSPPRASHLRPPSLSTRSRPEAPRDVPDLDVAEPDARLAEATAATLPTSARAASIVTPERATSPRRSVWVPWPLHSLDRKTRTGESDELDRGAGQSDRS